uniref:Uncharacterized protein n=1 Tax=Panagrolaimus superbus TaxID=310955 RepID=A0A914Y3K2_9BILA
MDLSQTLLNILNTSYSPDSDENVAAVGGLNDADSSEEEYYVCLKCEYLGIEEQNQCINNAQNVCSEKENQMIEQRESVQSESTGSNETTLSSQESSIANNIVTDASTHIKLELPIESSGNINNEKLISNFQSLTLPNSPNNNVAEVIQNVFGQNGSQVSYDVLPQYINTLIASNDMEGTEILDQPTTQSIGIQTEEIFPPAIEEAAVTTIPEVSDSSFPVDVSHETCVDRETDVANISETDNSPVSTNHEAPVNKEIPVTNISEAPVSFIHEATSMESNASNENPLTILNLNENSHSFETPVFKRFNRGRSGSEVPDDIATTQSSVNVSTTPGMSTPAYQNHTPKIDSKQLLSLFQKPSDDMYGDLSSLLKSAGIQITGEEDPEFLNEIKDVKIKVETPRSIKSETGVRKRRRSPHFYTPAKRRVTKKGSVGTVKVKRTGETKAFVEWDSDAYIESD